MARKIILTSFGQKALARPDGLSILKQKPTKRVYLGLFLIMMSYILGLTALAYLSYVAITMGKPLIIAVCGIFGFLFVHILFGVGIYLAGQNYASSVLLWATKRFLQKYT